MFSYLCKKLIRDTGDRPAPELAWKAVFVCVGPRHAPEIVENVLFVCAGVPRAPELE